MTQTGPDSSKDKAASPNLGAKNRLDQETSPYLLQHKDNPVHWQGVNETAFAEAKASKSRSCCRWAMQLVIGAMSAAHESLENPAIATLDERAFRQHQGRSGRAAGCGCHHLSNV